VRIITFSELGRIGKEAAAVYSFSLEDLRQKREVPRTW